MIVYARANEVSAIFSCNIKKTNPQILIMQCDVTLCIGTRNEATLNDREVTKILEQILCHRHFNICTYCMTVQL